MKAMVLSTLVTPDEMRRVLRKRLRERSAAWVEILGSEIPPGSHTKNEMLELLRAKLQGARRSRRRKPGQEPLARTAQSIRTGASAGSRNVKWLR